MILPSTPFRITGRHVLVAFILFFGAIIAVNALFITLAVRTFHGEDIPKAYSAGLRFNDQVALSEASRAAGWTMEPALEQRSGRAHLTIKVADARGDALADQLLRITLRRPSDAGLDRSLDLTTDSSGLAEATLDDLTAGQWDIVVAFERADGAAEMRRRLWLSK